jgi:hypothetical protein
MITGPFQNSGLFRMASPFEKSAYNKNATTTINRNLKIFNMNLFLHVTGARCKPFIVLGVLLFLLNDALRATPVSSKETDGVTTVTCTPPGATASVSGILTCTNKTVTLEGSSGSQGVTYLWSGTGGFSSM